MPSSGLAKTALINFTGGVLTVSCVLLVPAPDLKPRSRPGLVALPLGLVKTAAAVLTAGIVLSDGNTFFRAVTEAVVAAVAMAAGGVPLLLVSQVGTNGGGRIH